MAFWAVSEPALYTVLYTTALIAQADNANKTFTDTSLLPVAVWTAPDVTFCAMPAVVRPAEVLSSVPGSIIERPV